MHPSALDIGRRFFERYLASTPPGRILDVGGLDVNGSLRAVAPSGFDYVSVDLTPGRGVDVVLDDPYRLPFADGTFAAAVSTSCFEHDAFFWLTFAEMSRVVAEGGFIYLNAPSGGNFHRQPVDCWRFYPDAAGPLQAWAARSGQAVSLCESFVFEDRADIWQDFVAIFRKGSAAGSPPPLHADIPSNNVTTAAGELTRIVAETQHLRELRLLRRSLGLDENRPALDIDPRDFTVQRRRSDER